MLHKFDVDCSGKRVSWQQLYSAIADVTTRRARFERDALIVMIRPGRESLDGTRQDQFARTDRRPGRNSLFPVEMPDGFAPLTGTVARFTGRRIEPSVTAQKNEVPKSAAAAPPSPAADRVPETPASQKVAKPAATKAPKPADRPSNEVRPSTTAAEPQSKLPKVITPGSTPEPAAATAAKPKPAEPDGEQKGTSEPAKDQANAKPVPSQPVKPTIINVPGAAPDSGIKSTASKNAETSKQTTQQASKPPPAVAPPLQDSDAPAIENQQTEASDALATAASNIYADGPEAEPSATTPRAAPSYQAPTLGTTLLVFLCVAGLLTFLFATFRKLKARQPKTRPLKTAMRAENRQPASAGVNPNAAARTSVEPVEKPKTSQGKQDKPRVEPTFASAKRSQTDAVGSETGPREKELPASAPQPLSSLINAPTADTRQTREPELSLSRPDDGETGPARSGAFAIEARPQPTLPMPKTPKPDRSGGGQEADRIASTSVAAGPAPVLPATRDEALATLGVSPKARPDIIRKVIEGLRESWKIESAIDDVDRMHRRERLAQIEAASVLLNLQPDLKTTADETGISDAKSHPQ